MHSGSTDGNLYDSGTSFAGLSLFVFDVGGAVFGGVI